MMLTKIQFCYLVTLEAKNFVTPGKIDRYIVTLIISLLPEREPQLFTLFSSIRQHISWIIFRHVEMNYKRSGA